MLAPDDRWCDWLLRARHGGDDEYAAALRPMLDDIRDRLLDHAALRPGLDVIDVGCGDGLAGFGALEREPTSVVTFVDISPALLEHTRAIAHRRGFAERCRFLVASAESLAAIPDASADVVLVRAVLAYVDRKAVAMEEFRRVLRPGGRVSIVDPIFQDQALHLAGIAAQLRAGECAAATRYFELLHRCRSAHFPDSVDALSANPATNYNERDLLRLIGCAGFVDVHLRLHIDSIRAPRMSWPAFLGSAPFAGVPTVGEILHSRFAPEERLEFERFLRPDVEAGTALERNVNAYLFADAP